MKWFPMFSAEREHPVVATMRPGLFKFWINLRCATSLYGSGDQLVGVASVAFVCHARKGVAARYLAELMSLGLAACDGRGKYAAVELFTRGTPRLPAERWAALRRLVFERDDFTCRYCNKRGVRLECDHVVPLSRGGSNDPENLATSCFDCNRSKHNKLVEEWR